MCTLREQQDGAGVPEVVEADVRQTSKLKKGLEGAATEVGGFPYSYRVIGMVMIGFVVV